MHIELQRISRRRGWLPSIAAAVLMLGGLVPAAHAVQASLVIDASTGNILSEEHADELNHPASLTKMMTIYLAFQALHAGRLTLDQQLPVSAHAANMAPTKLGLRAGQSISVRDCILGMVTKSANDAATVVAEKLGGSEDHFVEMMNAQGVLLGMARTHFASASGLPRPNDATTARDMSRLATALYRDFPRQVPMFSTREFTFRGRVVRGHNHLMERYAGMDGLKTGYTAAAGFNLASTAVRGGHRLFGVVLGENSVKTRDNLMAQLLDDGFEQWQSSPTLIAAAGKPEHRMTQKVLAALSPIDTAEAEPATKVLPAKTARHHASRRATPVTKTTKVSVAQAKRHPKTAVRVASVDTRSVSCRTPGRSTRACPVHAHGKAGPTRLAKRDAKTVKVHRSRQRD